MNHKPIITKAGTELPMLDLRGKPYLQVAHRLVWFREEHPNWTIETQLVEHDATHAIFRAMIFNTEEKDNTGSFRGPDKLLATATGHESKNDFPDFIEKAETKAVGRALAMVGYGTQFAPELEEGNRLADSPITPAKKATNPTETVTPPASPSKPPVGQRTFTAQKQASLEKLKEIAMLVETKLGTNAGDQADILAKLNKRFALSITKATELSNAKADVIIETLKELPDMEPFKS